MEIVGPAIFALAHLRDLVLRIAAITVPPCAHDIEALQRESLRVDLVVAAGTALVGPMLVELLPNRYGSARVRINGGYSRRWRRHHPAEDTLADPLSAD